MARVIRRTFARLATRAELWNGNRERWRDLPDPGHPIRWAWQQHADRRARTASLVERFPDVRVIRLGTPAHARDWLDTIPAQNRSGN
jgi:hypothetical protein